jgi:hypothetical protein
MTAMLKGTHTYTHTHTHTQTQGLGFRFQLAQPLGASVRNDGEAHGKPCPRRTQIHELRRRCVSQGAHKSWILPAAPIAPHKFKSVLTFEGYAGSELALKMPFLRGMFTFGGYAGSEFQHNIQAVSFTYAQPASTAAKHAR